VNLKHSLQLLKLAQRVLDLSFWPPAAAIVMLSPFTVSMGHSLMLLASRMHTYNKAAQTRVLQLPIADELLLDKDKRELL
jgi:hypothetical protein